jgi:hypothetical protein
MRELSVFKTGTVISEAVVCLARPSENRASMSRAKSRGSHPIAGFSEGYAVLACMLFLRLGD